MNPPSLADLRQAVLLRLPVLDKPILPAEIDLELNRQLDIWTRENSIVKISLLSDILANVNPVKVNPLPGYEVGRCLEATLRVGGQTQVILKVRSPEQMYEEYIDWPDTATQSSIPEYLIFDFDPNTNGSVLTDSVWLWPGPNQSYLVANNSGLVMVCTAVTDGLLRSDSDQVPATARQCKEELIEGTLEALTARRKESDLAQYHGGLVTKTRRMARRTAYNERTGRSGTQVYWT